MRLYLKRNKGDISAIGEYDFKTKEMIVLKGSRISDRIAYSEKFRGAKTIEKNRATAVDGCNVVADIKFKSASTAANFVTGSSTNGLTAWKDESGNKLKDLIKGANGDKGVTQ